MPLPFYSPRKMRGLDFVLQLWTRYYYALVGPAVLPIPQF